MLGKIEQALFAWADAGCSEHSIINSLIDLPIGDSLAIATVTFQCDESEDLLNYMVTVAYREPKLVYNKGWKNFKTEEGAREFLEYSNRVDELLNETQFFL